ncbi:MAG: peptide-methionine (S)-S-oxide reductase MsrA [Firmicutes bacterium]|nr:peptide-methionine (S)-S-oxide reductase MsrA [Bacillota bacterium]
MPELATFAGGCFWCMVAPFEDLPGVLKAISGYTGGDTPHPTYEEVCEKNTGHHEAVQITFKPDILPYEVLLDIFWRQIDPTDPGGQFADRGSSYRTAIFYHNDRQKMLAETSRQLLEKSNRFDTPIVTSILPAVKFWPAEDYHQDFYKNNPTHYGRYHRGSGRERFLREKWSADVDPETLKEKLTPLQFHVTRENGTEPPFRNEYWNETRAGIYVDLVTGHVLFTSRDKFDGGCGWPSFTRPLHPDLIEERTDRSLGISRTEVRSRLSASHLGHVFDDGPEPAGRRYCINSAALEFIPLEKMEQQGYGRYLGLFHGDTETKK